MVDTGGIEDLSSSNETPIPKGITTYEDFLKFKSEAGFNEGHSGTFQSDKDGRFLYIKRQYIFSSEEELKNGTKLLEHFRDVGIFHPQIEWGTYKNPNNEYQIYAVMPPLEVCSNLKPIPEGMQEFIKRSPDQDETSWNIDLLSRSNSHVREWFTRLDPTFDVNKSEGNQLLYLLNYREASHTDNWGWDKKSGRLYPVDMEVVGLNDPKNITITSNWIKGKPLTHLIDR
ncbi:MAG TPA: hypothetical protein VHE53_03730 [Patescibacteria group bacterium]|nr:hypothetical protein [Patescibacteria group bacterium]